MNVAFGWLGRMVLVFSLFVMAACGTTLEAQQDRFKRTKDSIEALVAKNPALRGSLTEKVKEFQTEHDAIVKAGGEDAKTNLARLNGRMDDYIKLVAPAPASVASAAGGKLGNATGLPPGAAAASTASAALIAPPMGGKLGLGAPATGAPVGFGAPATAAPMGLGAPATAAPMGLGAPATAAPGLGAPGLGAPGLGAPGTAAPAGKLGGAPVTAAAPTGLGAPAPVPGGKLGTP